MTDTLSNVAVQLRGERDAIAGEINSIKVGLAEREAALGKIDNALKALGHKPTPSKPRKPAATKDEVLEAIASVLSFTDELAEAELRKQVEQRIVDAGKSRMGFALRFKEALQDSSLISSEAGIRLVAEPNQLQSA